MLFNSLAFLIFFPIVCLLYWVLPQRWRNPMLLVSSYYFYMNWEPAYALLIFISTVTTWAAALYVHRGQRKRLCMWGCVAFNLGILFVFKYFNFAGESITALLSLLHLRIEIPAFTLLLPVGISFYTFQALGYILDVYHGKETPEHSLATYALFVSFYPQLVAGPIERSNNLIPQFKSRHIFNADMFIAGLKLMLLGYFMKLCIADNVSGYVDAVFNNLEHHNGHSVLLASFFFTFQIFCDFGGYSLIAIGAARCMGFRLMNNFNHPYLARSPRDFWRRWHISLTKWFTDYVYIGMGGNRCTKRRHHFNLIATMLISGLWHGAAWNFVAWGGAHGLLLSGQALAKSNKSNDTAEPQRSIWHWLKMACCWFGTFLVVMLCWIFFRANSLADAFTALKKILTEPGMLYKGEGIPSLVLPMLLIGVLMFKEMHDEWGWHVPLLDHAGLARDIFLSALLIIVILLCASFSGGQFIYFQF